MSNCPPDQKIDASNGGVVAYLADLLKLSPAQVRGTVVQLTKRLGAAALNGTDEYRVPADQDLVIFQAQAAWAPTALSTEPVLNANFLGGVADLAFARMSNVTVQLRDKDRSLDMFDARAVSLGGLSALGGGPAYWPAQAPLLLQSSHTMQAIFTVLDSTAAVIGNNADYSLLLTGVLIPHRL